MGLASTLSKVRMSRWSAGSPGTIQVEWKLFCLKSLRWDEAFGEILERPDAARSNVAIVPECRLSHLGSISLSQLAGVRRKPCIF
jgi:hypothetical protein